MVQEWRPTPPVSATTPPPLITAATTRLPPPRSDVGLWRGGQRTYVGGGSGGARECQARLPPERVLYENPCTARGAGVGMVLEPFYRIVDHFFTHTEANSTHQLTPLSLNSLNNWLMACHVRHWGTLAKNN